jgi:radical SAM superfamily enzyme YgiQ (UPF0313 family)
VRVIIVEPAPVDHRWFHTYIRTPHLGPPILARLLREAGHQAHVFSEFVRPLNLQELSGSDLIGISINTGLTHQRAYEIAREVRRLYPNVQLVAGGHHATINCDEALRHVDYVVRGYAETSFPRLVEEIRMGNWRPTTPGVSFRDPDTNEVVNNPSAPSTPINTRPALEAIAGYPEVVSEHRWHLHRFGTFLPLSFFSRGCGFRCNFCTIPLADDPRMSYRTPDEVIEDLRYQLDFYRFPYGRPRVWLIDDNFGQERTRTLEFLRVLAEVDLGCDFVVQARVEISRDPELLTMMRRARLRAVYIGVESVSDDSLKSMHKYSNCVKIERTVRAVHRAGIDAVALLMFGNDGDRPGVGSVTLNFLRGLGVKFICPQITVPYPGTTFHRQVVGEGRLFSSDYRFCNRRPVHFPRTMRPSQVVREIVETTLRHHSAVRAVADALRLRVHNLITRRGILDGGFIERTLAAIPELEELERDYYDSDDRLREDRVCRDAERGVLLERAATLTLNGRAAKSDADTFFEWQALDARRRPSTAARDHGRMD